jgi:hypothetical protein
LDVDLTDRKFSFVPCINYHLGIMYVHTSREGFSSSRWKRVCLHVAMMADAPLWSVMLYNSDVIDGYVFHIGQFHTTCQDLSYLQSYIYFIAWS